MSAFLWPTLVAMARYYAILASRILFGGVSKCPLRDWNETLLAVMKSALTVRNSPPPDVRKVCMAVSVLLKARNRKVSAVQNIVSVLLYAGQCWALFKVGKFIHTIMHAVII